MRRTLARKLPEPGVTATTAWSVWALLLGMGLLMMGNGMQGTLLGLRASDEGFSGTITGLVMSGYFVGFLGGAALAPAIIRKAGHVRVFAAMASLASVAILVHAMLVTPSVWAAMRILTGFAYCGLYIVTESWLNDRATNESRGRLLSVYLIITYVGMGGGQLTMNIASPSEYELFLINAIILSVALVPILLSANNEPTQTAPEGLKLRELFRISPVGTVGAFATGMADGALFSMGAVFARGYDFSVFQVSIFMAALIAGGALLQWPIGRLSDGMDRRRVIVGVSLGVALLAGIAIPVAQASHTALIVLGILFGGAVLPMYSLYAAYTNDHLRPSQMVAANSGLYTAVASGAVLGPALTGWLMDWFGPSGFLVFFIATHLAMVAFTLYRMTRTESPQPDEQVHYAPLPGRTGELSESWVEEVTDHSETDDGDSEIEDNDDGEGTAGTPQKR